MKDIQIELSRKAEEHCYTVTDVLTDKVIGLIDEREGKYMNADTGEYHPTIGQALDEIMDNHQDTL